MVVTSVAVVSVFSLFVIFTGEGRGFYLPEILFCVVATIGFGLTRIGRRPLSLWTASGVISGGRLSRTRILAWATVVRHAGQPDARAIPLSP